MLTIPQTQASRKNLVTFLFLLNYWIVVILLLATGTSISYLTLLWILGGFVCYFFIVLSRYHFWTVVVKFYKYIRTTFLITKIKNSTNNPQKLLRLQPQITKFIEYDYFSYDQMKLIYILGGRNFEDLQDDFESYIKFRSEANEFDQVLNLLEDIYPRIDDYYDLFYGMYHTILTIDNFYFRIQNLVHFLLKLKNLSPIYFNQFDLFLKTDLDEVLLEDCESNEKFGFLFDQLVFYFCEIELKSIIRDQTPMENLQDISNSNGNLLLFEMWQQIVENKGQFCTKGKFIPIEQFKRVHMVLENRKITEVDQYQHLMNIFSQNHTFGFLEYCCLSPEIYTWIHFQIKWPELEKVYFDLYNVPLSAENELVL